MLRFLLDKFRHAPGPFQQARIITSDLAEEIIDLASYYVKQRPLFDVDDAPCTAPKVVPPPAAAPPEPTRTAIAEPPPAAAEPPPTPKAAENKSPTLAAPPTRKMEVGPELALALDNPANLKKQEFKVLAILWDAKQRKLGALSAKAIASHGEDIGIAIRHENVRKVIRMRLNKHVKAQTEEGENGSIYRYLISRVGEDHFTANYLG